jgi:antitoxin (DNA-binding transcriptional repressor) of toxin-antitoxin stability system
MERVMSKSKFKPKALYYFRKVEQTGKALIITDRGKPVLKIEPYTEDPLEAVKKLRNTVLRYDDPTAPVGEDSWEALN